MPGSNEEYLRFATSIDPLPNLWADGSVVTAGEVTDLLVLRRYHRTHNRKPRTTQAQRRASRLLRSFLNPDQRLQLSRGKSFRAAAPSGRTYRFWPHTAYCEEVTRHGSRWFALRSFCLHDDTSDPALRMPPADLTLAHLLLIAADEPRFLGTANATGRRDQLWNGAYRTELRRHRADVAIALANEFNYTVTMTAV